VVRKVITTTTTSTGSPRDKLRASSCLICEQEQNAGGQPRAEPCEWAFDWSGGRTWRQLRGAACGRRGGGVAARAKRTLGRRRAGLARVGAPGRLADWATTTCALGIVRGASDIVARVGRWAGGKHAFMAHT